MTLPQKLVKGEVQNPLDVCVIYKRERAMQDKCFLDAYGIWSLDSCCQPVWYMCLKTKNCCLKTFVEIHVGEKVYGNIRNVV